MMMPIKAAKGIFSYLDLKLDNDYSNGELYKQKIYWTDNKLKYDVTYIELYLHLLQYNNSLILKKFMKVSNSSV